MTKHTCHAMGCETPCPPERLFCLPHWKMTPKPLQSAVWRSYRRGQCDDKRPSRAWLLAAWGAIYAVAVLEGRLDAQTAERLYQEKRDRLNGGS